MEEHILFSGYYGFDNSGDDAILQAIIQDIRKQDPSKKLTVLSYNPNRTSAIYNVDAAQRFHLKSVIRAIKDTDLLISGGGSLLQDVTSSRSLYYYLSIILIAKFYNKKVYVYANGVGPIEGKLNRKMTKYVLNKVDLITLRDEDSYETIRSLGVTKPKTLVTSDPVYSLDNIDRKKVLKIMMREGIPTNRKYIGVAVRAWPKVQNLHKKLAQTLDMVYNKLGEDILFIPLHYPEDVEFSESIQQLMKARNHSHIVRGNYGVQELKGLVGITETILAMRLHALIYGVAELTPIVGLIYDPKVKAHLNMLDIEKSADVENFNEKDLAKLIVDTYYNRSIHRRNLRQKRKEFQALSLENVDYIFKLLEDRHE